MTDHARAQAWKAMLPLRRIALWRDGLRLPLRQTVHRVAGVTRMRAAGLPAA
jgi:hypothetical protein